MWTNPDTGFGKVCPGDNRIAQIHNIIIPRLQKPANLDSLLLPEDDMQLIRKRSNDYTMMLAGGKLFKVTGPNNWAEAEKGNTPRIVLDDDEYDLLVKNLGPVIG